MNVEKVSQNIQKITVYVKNSLKWKKCTVSRIGEQYYCGTSEG